MAVLGVVVIKSDMTQLGIWDLYYLCCVDDVITETDPTAEGDLYKFTFNIISM